MINIELKESEIKKLFAEFEDIIFRDGDKKIMFNKFKELRKKFWENNCVS